VGDKVWKTSDPELDRRLRRSFAGDTPRFQRPVAIEVRGAAGEPLTLRAQDELGNRAEVTSRTPLVRAEKQPLTGARLRAQLGRLGGTPFKLGELKNFLRGDLLLPLSELNRLRRHLVSELERRRAQPKRWQLSSRGRPLEENESPKSCRPEVNERGIADRQSAVAQTDSPPCRRLAVGDTAGCQPALRTRAVHCQAEGPGPIVRAGHKT
jgi:hypothetical protein